MEKIIHIARVPLYNGLAKLLYVDVCLEKGIPVEYWDVGEVCGVGQSTKSEGKHPIEVRVSSLEMLQRKISAQNMKITLFNVQLAYSFDSRKIYYLLNKNSCLQSVFSSGFVPVPKVGRLERLLSEAKNPSKLNNSLFKKISAKVHKKIYRIQAPSIAFVAGRQAAKACCWAPIKIKINSHDYDECLIEQNQPMEADAHNYIVFLDEYLPFHPDIKLLGLKHVCAEKYFSSMNAFFDKLEHKTDMKVIVAGHPKSSYAGNEYGIRKILRNRTISLIKNCSLVVAHDSTAIGAAVAFNKPIMFVYNNEIERVSKDLRFHQMQCIENWARCLGAKSFNIDKDMSDASFSIPCVDKRKYVEYIFDYLAWPETMHSTSGDMFAVQLRGIEREVI